MNHLKTRSVVKSIYMNRLFVPVLFFLSILTACNKGAADANIDGQWKWINSIGGSWKVTPGKDSTVILTLNSNKTYTTALNGYIVCRGSFQITTTQNNTILILNDFISTGGLSLGSEIIQTDGKVQLQLTNYPVHPEDFISYFTK